MFLFFNKAKDKIKALLWDKNGFILLYKRLEKGKFIFPNDVVADYYAISSDLLQWLLQGFDFYRLQHYPELKIASYY